MSIRSCAIALVGLLACAPLAQAQSQSWDKVLPGSRRFVVLDAFGGEAVLDKETGLVWERTPGDLNRDGVIGVGDPRTWFTAHGTCRSKIVGDRRGWRLPTFEELASLVDPSNAFPRVTLPAGHPFIGDFSSSFDFWSANTLVSAPTIALALPFGTDYDAIGFPKDSELFLWCVRGGRGVDPQ